MRTESVLIVLGLFGSIMRYSRVLVVLAHRKRGVEVRQIAFAFGEREPADSTRLPHASAALLDSNRLGAVCYYAVPHLLSALFFPRGKVELYLEQWPRSQLRAPIHPVRC